MKENELDHGDWRIQTVAHLAEGFHNPWTNQWVDKGTRLTVVANVNLTRKKTLTIPVPNATAIMLNAARVAYEEARQLRAKSGLDKSLKSNVTFIQDSDAIDYLERIIESVLLGFTAIEAFANETIPEDYVLEHYRTSDVILEVSDKREIERFVSLDEKLHRILPEIVGCASPKGTRSWQEYKQLKKTRDRIVHMKTEDRRSSGPDIDTVWRSILLSPAPHKASKAIIDHFVSAMKEKPRWSSRFNYRD